MMPMTRLPLIYKISLDLAASYNFHLTARAYAIPGEYDGERYQCLFTLEGMPTALVARVRQGELVLSFFSEAKLPPSGLLEIASHILGFHEDLEEFYTIVSRDPLLHPVSTTLRGMHMKATYSLWNGFLIAICQQNASFRQGWTMYSKMVHLFGDTKILEDGSTVHAPPTPNALLTIGERIRKAGTGYRAEAILNLAQHFSEHPELQAPPREVSEKLLQQLKRVKGVGEYSFRVALLFSQRRYDLPPVDRWVARLLSEIYANKPLNLKEAEELSKQLWGSWCGLSIFFMTITLNAAIISKALEVAKTGRINPITDGDQLSPLTLWRNLKL